MAEVATSLRRDIGRWGLVALGISGVVGSGWLYAPFEAAKQAGPESLIAWIIGAALMLIMGFCLAEIACAFPVSGSSAQVATATHGRGMSLVNMWLLYFAYVATPAIEATSIVTYSAVYLPWMIVGKEANLSLAGQGVTILLVGFFTVLNFFGVRWFIRINSWITWWKLAIPIAVAIALLCTRFESKNFTSSGIDRDPITLQNLLGALSSGGIIFTLCGFRIIADLAAESRNPSKDIPFAFLVSTLFSVVLYLVVQIAFIGALDVSSISQGWSQLQLSQDNAPFLAILMIAGLPLLAKVLYIDAIISPGGSCLAYVASTGRIGYAAAQQSFAPKIFLALTKSGVPIVSLLVCWGVSAIIVLAYPKWDQLAKLNTAAYFLSVITVPVSVAVIRRLDPTGHRPFRLPGGIVMCAVAFATNVLIVYWSGIWSFAPLMGILAVIMLIAVITPRIRGTAPIITNWRPLRWLIPTIITLLVVGVFGNKDFGGSGWLPGSLDSAIIGVLSIGLFILAIRSTRPVKEVQAELAVLRAVANKSN